jgi:thiamine-monophosphate kinase
MLSEFEIIRRFFEQPARRPARGGRTPAGAVLGIGDDAALLRPSGDMELAVSTDLLVEGTHFRAGSAPRALGHKALAVNLSDLAAMGAAPRWATLAISLPSADEAWLREFAAGFFALAARFGVELVGGDTTRGPLCICVTIAGEVPAGLALLRGGAAPGDDIWVSGELGGAALALARPEYTEVAARLEQPEPRVELGERLRGIASAAIDVSDGLAGDLRHILERSRVGARVDYESIPRPAAFGRLGDPELEMRCVLAGGDDYELLFTAPQARRKELEALGAEIGLPLTRIGAIRLGDPSLMVFDAQGRPLPVTHGYDHFAA